MDRKLGDCLKDDDSRSKRTIDCEREENTASNGDCSIDVKDDHSGAARSGNSEKSKVERVCRICHFGKDPSSKELELIPLGCDCKGELGSSHQHCAQTWFSQKGDRICEICGKTAKNMSNNAEETSIFMMDWDEMRAVATTLDISRGSSCRCMQCVCNLVLASLVLLSLLLWFIRGIKIL